MACAGDVRAELFTGSLILRFGVPRVTAVGLVLLGLSAVVGLAGMTVAHFWIALILLGIGWNSPSSAPPDGV